VRRDRINDHALWGGRDSKIGHRDLYKAVHLKYARTLVIRSTPSDQIYGLKIVSQYDDLLGKLDKIVVSCTAISHMQSSTGRNDVGENGKPLQAWMDLTPGLSLCTDHSRTVHLCLTLPEEHDRRSGIMLRVQRRYHNACWVCWSCWSMTRKRSYAVWVSQALRCFLSLLAFIPRIVLISPSSVIFHLEFNPFMTSSIS